MVTQKCHHHLVVMRQVIVMLAQFEYQKLNMFFALNNISFLRFISSVAIFSPLNSRRQSESSLPCGLAQEPLLPVSLTDSQASYDARLRYRNTLILSGASTRHFPSLRDFSQLHDFTPLDSFKFILVSQRQHQNTTFCAPSSINSY